MGDEPITAPSGSAVEHSNGSPPGRTSTASPSGLSPLVGHARRELNRIAQRPDGGFDEDQVSVNEHLLKMIAIFSKEGHSGFSAGWATAALNRLLKFMPLTPLQGTPDEWMEVGERDGVPTFQNTRYSAVFKEGVDGQAYDTGRRVYNDGSSLYQKGGDRVPITFPYSPPSQPEVIPVNALGHRTFKVDYVYGGEEWDCTYPWGERGELVDDRPEPFVPYWIKSLVQGPDLYVISIPTSFDIEEDDFEDFEDRFFLSEEEAKGALEEAKEELRAVAKKAETGDPPSETATPSKKPAPEPMPEPEPRVIHKQPPYKPPPGALGFTGDICPQCGGSSMLRNGSCLLCSDCGHTTGCS